jgi:hypothetical protein
MKLHCRIFRDDVLAEERLFDQDIIKIGRLESSHISLKDIARMHAVLERDHHGVWRLLDLGSSMGSKLNGVFVDKNAEIGSSGELQFGSWRILFLATEGTDVLPSNGPAPDPREHHRTLLEALIKEMHKHSSQTARSAEKLLATWSLLDEERKRKMLRTLIVAIRSARVDSVRVGRQMVASMLKLGSEGIAEIYELEPAQALVQARAALITVAQAKAALAALESLKLREVVDNAPTEEDEERKESISHFVKGHEDLEELLQQEMVMGVSILSACLSRAGGHVLTHRERVELRHAYEKLEKAANEASASTSA